MSRALRSRGRRYGYAWALVAIGLGAAVGWLSTVDWLEVFK